MMKSLVVFGLVAAGQAFADGTAAPAAGAPQAPGTFSMLVPFIAMFAVMYFLMIRPQQKKMKEQQTMLNALTDGDEVVTAAGIIGKVKKLDERVVTLEIDRGVEIKLLKSTIAQKTSSAGKTA